MITAAIGFFSLAALLGIFLISFVLRDKETPKGVVFVHGPLAATGLILTWIYVFKQGPGPIESAVLFTMAALLGFVMIYRDLTGKSLPKWLAISHGLIAVTGFIFLLIFATNIN